MRTRGRAWLVLALTTVPGLARATAIGASWTGSIDYTRPALAAVFPIGTPASGSFQIDTAATDANADPSIGSYLGAATAIVFRFGSYEFGASSGDVFVADTLGDGFGVSIANFGAPLPGVPSIEGIAVTGIQFLLESGPGALSSDAFPLSLDLATFHGGAVMNAEDGYMTSAAASSLSYPVPEPETGLLLAIGLLALSARARHKSQPRVRSR